MMWPPSVCRIRLTEGGRRKHNLWLPLFLIWPPMLAIGAVAWLVVLVIATVKGKLKVAFRSGPLFLGLFCALRGLHVELAEADGDVLFYFA